MNNLPPVRSIVPKTWPKHTNDRWACGSCQSCPILWLPATTGSHWLLRLLVGNHPKSLLIRSGLWHWKSWISIVWSKNCLLTIYRLIEKQFLSDPLLHEDLIPFGSGSLLWVQKGVSELNEEILPLFISAGRLANFGSSKFTIAVENTAPIGIVAGISMSQFMSIYRSTAY